MPKRVAFHTLGCKLNYAETATIGRAFSERGFEVVDLYARPGAVRAGYRSPTTL